ncbi:class I SAM-dependent methyltransferase [bacterium]|nr:class I SAM-dependent methyltransferase [FCB group bacterium]MBL7192253.1 class I SAM-dependent methyltransferase [bacterium]
MISLITCKPEYILDVGCGNGLTAKTIKEKFDSKYVLGIEVDREAAKEAEKKLDEILVIDLNKTKLELNRKFDLIVLADILEHLVSPEDLLNQIRSILNIDGQVVISIPNVRNWSIIFEIIFKGDWRYRDEGILDRTHLRFFTKKSAIRMIESTGFTINKYCYRIRPRDVIPNLISLTIFRDFFITQHYFSLKLKEGKT